MFLGLEIYGPKHFMVKSYHETGSYLLGSKDGEGPKCSCTHMLLNIMPAAYPSGREWKVSNYKPALFFNSLQWEESRQSCKLLLKVDHVRNSEVSKPCTTAPRVPQQTRVLNKQDC